MREKLCRWKSGWRALEFPLQAQQTVDLEHSHGTLVLVRAGEREREREREKSETKQGVMV